MEKHKLFEAADLLKAAIENEDRQHFGLERLGVKLCVDELNRCIDVYIHDMCLVSLFDFTLKNADLHVYGYLIRSAAILAHCSYAQGRKDQAIKSRGIMTWERMCRKVEEDNNG